jgi:hypothetical protein
LIEKSSKSTNTPIFFASCLSQRIRTVEPIRFSIPCLKHQQEDNMQEQTSDDRAQTKRRLIGKLRIAVGGLVVAAASLSTAPAAEASTAPAQKPTLEERVTQLQQQIGDKLHEQTEASAMLAAFHNWGNHWDKWHNWHNWANWHNH